MTSGRPQRKRRRFTEREVLATLIHQGIVVRCFRCQATFLNGNVLDPPHDAMHAEREHIHEFELGGSDTPANCRYSARECHKVITNGTKATSAGSSKHRIAKAKRIARGGKRKGPGPKSRPFAKKPVGYRSPLSKESRSRFVAKRGARGGGGDATERPTRS